ncbi:MAG: hypothetical protein ACXWM7_06920 [Parachlamydiaceae bacterium]
MFVDNWLSEIISDTMRFDYATATQYEELTGEKPMRSESGTFCKQDGRGGIPVWLLPDSVSKRFRQSTSFKE